jgi:Gelsolin repeat.
LQNFTSFFPLTSKVPCAAASVNSGDVFVLDAGLKIYQFQGKECGGAERAKASTFSRSLDDERGGKAEVIVFGISFFFFLSISFIHSFFFR